MMKKLCSLFLAMLILMTSLSVFAADSTTALLFDMDLSTYTAETKTVTSSAGTNTITVNGDPSLGTVNGKNYLTFATPEYYTANEQSTDNYISVYNDSFASQKELTFEFWARDNNSINKYCTMFSLATRTGGNESANVQTFLMSSENAYMVRPSGEKTEADNTEQAEIIRYKDAVSARGTWAHYVVTRKYDEEAATYSTSFYLNGVLQSVTSVTNEGKYKAWSKRSANSKYLSIGNDATRTYGFIGDIAEFRVYDGILSEEKVTTNYNQKKDSFIEYADTMELESVSASGNTISAESSELTLRFNNYIDVSTIDGSITILNAEDRTPLKGGVALKAGTGLTKAVTVKYGKLELGKQYILQVTSALKSKNNKVCVPVEKEYTAQTEYIFYEDFMSDDFVVGQNPPTNKGINYFSSVWNEDKQMATTKSDNSSNMIVCGDDTFKYISMHGGGNPKVDNRIKLNFSEVIDAEVFVIDYKVRPNDSDGVNMEAPRNLLTLTSQNNKGLQLADMRKAKIVNNSSSLGLTTLTGSVSFSEETKDEYDFYDMQVLLQKNENGFYIIKLANANASEDGEAVYTTKDITGIKAMELAHLYPLDMAQATKATADIARIAIYKRSVPDVLCTNLSSLERNEDEFYVVFTDDIDAASIKASSFNLVDESGERVNMEFVNYIESERKAVFKLYQYLKSDAEYTFSFGNMSSKSGLLIYNSEYTATTAPEEVDIASVALVNQAGAPIASLNGATTIKVTAKVANDSGSVVYARAALVIYDATGRIEKTIFSSSVEADKTVAVGGSKELVLQTAEGDLKPNGKVKLLVWKEALNGSLPIVEPITYQYSN